jgi:hypothetical protein
MDEFVEYLPVFVASRVISVYNHVEEPASNVLGSPTRAGGGVGGAGVGVQGGSRVEGHAHGAWLRWREEESSRPACSAVWATPPSQLCLLTSRARVPPPFGCGSAPLPAGYGLSLVWLSTGGVRVWWG